MHERFVNSHKFTNQRGRFCAIYLRALGEGGDAFIAASAAQKFMRIGYQTTASSDFDSQLIALSQMTPEDALICISHSGKTRNICSLAKVAREHGIKVITITDYFSRSAAGKALGYSFIDRFFFLRCNGRSAGQACACAVSAGYAVSIRSDEKKSSLQPLIDNVNEYRPLQ